jgi:2,4-dienoyl-CoA reductase-like NADH-dependent reductase (Old Yellow Enzyme family)
MTSRLFEKYTLNNNIEVPGRLVIAPLTLRSSNPDGTINDGERNYLKSRATGVGLYILGSAAVSQEGISFINQPRAISEKDLPSLKERAQIIKSQGALAINQIQHGGLLSNKEYSGLDPMAPSAEVANEALKARGLYKNPVKEFTNEDILSLIKKFAYATELSIKAGYDGVEIHGANNYLIHQFYSPFYNRRTDEWGGSDEKRMNFPIKVIEACCEVREKMKKPEFIIGYRLSPEEPFNPGLTMDETVKLLKVLVTKPLQYIHISQWNFFKPARRGKGAGEERLKIIHNETKGKVALIGCGGIRSENDFNKALDTGFCEFIAVGGASMINKNLGILLKENKGNLLELEIDPEHREKYDMPDNLWNLSIQGIDYYPPVKGKNTKRLDV